jgi:predicted nuclease of predicted toxin-antitoxin system
MDGNAKFLIDECLSPYLAEIAKREFGFYAVHVPWLGKPPRASKSWKDPDIVARIAIDPHIFVINNRRDFVGKFYRAAKLDLHEGLVIILKKSDYAREIEQIRALMQRIVSMESLVNKLIEIDSVGVIRIADWPALEATDPWQDPFIGNTRERKGS